MTKKEYGEFLDRLTELFPPDPEFKKEYILKFQKDWINDNFLQRLYMV